MEKTESTMERDVIVTVCGEAPAESIEFCQSHEHLAIRPGQSARLNPALCIDEPERTLRELERYKAAGGNTVIDAQPVGCCRDAKILQMLSAQSGVQIIASTGFHKMAFYPDVHWIREKSEAYLAKLFTDEILCGMFDDGDEAEPSVRTEIRAGQIKTALDICGLTPLYRRLFRAAVSAARAGGVPLMIHVENHADPLPLLAYLKSLDLPAERMIFCHLDRACGDLSVHKKIAEQGAYLEYDTIGRSKYHSDERETEIFREMLDAGFEDRILFSLDTTRERLKAYTPEGIGLDYILKSFIPRLLEAGVTETQIRKISRENCRRAFSLKCL